MKFLTIILGIAMMIIAAGCNDTSEVAKKETKAIDLANFDTTVKPGDDFYLYVNGGWIKKNPIPPEYSRYSAFTQLYESNLNKLKTLFEKVSKLKDAKKGSIEQQIGDYYYAGMNKKLIEELGYEPIKPWLEKINNLNNTDDVISMLAEMHLVGLNPLFVLYAGQDEKNSDMVIANLYQGGLGLGNRDYYFKEDKRSKEIRKEYVKHIANMFKLIGYNDKDAEKVAKDIFEFEKNLAEKSRTNVELRDPQANYNKKDIAQLQNEAKEFDWNKFFDEMGIKKTDEINVSQPEFFANAAKTLKTYPLEMWKAYLTWNLLRGSANYLSSDFVNEHFHFYGTVLTGTEKLEERWKRVLNQTSSDLGEAVGQLYVKEYFPPEAKKRMLTLVENLRKALAIRIEKLDWMSEDTKKEALEKLSKINVKVGYPDKWIDYSSVDITRDNYFQNTINAGKFNVMRRLKKIGNPPDRKEWHMTPQTVNAYYNPNMNEIVFPAAILQPPFFNMEADDAVNYAAIGTVIGHEMTHGFDDQGRQYDKDGNLRDWWTEEDSKRFSDKVQKLVDQYDNFVAIDTFKVNGKLTLGENIADFGGITVSYTAWLLANGGKLPTKKIDGFTPQQRFFISYAQIWRNNIRDEEMMRRLRDDVHSPGRFRVLGVLQNVPEFYEAFDVKPGDKMYLPPEERAKIW
jgi:putative endopeptidase